MKEVPPEVERPVGYIIYNFAWSRLNRRHVTVPP